jgi:tetratricopeptide (TPR) repeat protein
MPDLFKEWNENILWLYKYVFAVIPGFLGITLPQINELLDDYRRRLIQSGYSERTYLYVKGEIARELGDFAVGNECLDRAMQLKRDRQSDCKACERNYLASTYFEVGDWQRCIDHAQPILQGDERCTSVPAPVPARTLGYSALAYIHLGRLEEANLALERCIELTNNPRFVAQSGHCLEAAARLSRFSLGIDLLEMRLRWALESTTYLNKLSFYSRAIYFLSLVVNREDVPLRLNQLPSGCQNEWASSVAKWLEQESSDLALAVDRRNGNTHWSQLSLRMKEGATPLLVAK